MNTPSRFERESERMLRIEVDGGVWLKPGAAVAYRGDIGFERRPTLEATSFEDAAMRELSPLVRAIGKGQLYCGHRGEHVWPTRLNGETMFVASPDLLAFEESLSFEMMLLGDGLSIAAGGLVIVRLSGHGTLAFGGHGEPLSLQVTPDMPVTTDPHATIAWSEGVKPTLRTDLSWRSVFRHGGSEPVQMFFEGNGVVLIQPYEDAARFQPGFNAKTLKALIA
jgi:uncharacterized protein (AIM24 family)